MSDDTEITGSQMTSFCRYDTVRFEGFSEWLLSNLERIVQAIRKSDTVASVTDLYERLEEHINDFDNPHNFDISEYGEELLQQLYDAYLAQGYTGTVVDMFDQMIKDVTIENSSNIQKSASMSKVPNVIGWNTLFENHTSKKTAHYDIFRCLRIDEKMCFLEPVWSFVTLFKEHWDVYADDGYTLDTWNVQEGSLFFEYLIANTDDRTLVTIEQQEHQLIFGIETVDGAPVFICKVDSNTIFTSSLMTENMPMVDRVIITYNKRDKSLHWRTMLERGLVEDITLSPAVTLYLNAPFQEKCTDDTYAVIRSIKYYNQEIAPDQMPIVM